MDSGKKEEGQKMLSGKNTAQGEEEANIFLGWEN